MELEVGEVVFDCMVVIEIECLFETSCTVEEVDLSVGLFSVEQVHDVASHRSHAGTTTDEDEFLICRKVVREEEFSVRT